jgi:Sec-independent protein translocase protein TatA
MPKLGFPELIIIVVIVVVIMFVTRSRKTR